MAEKEKKSFAKQFFEGLSEKPNSLSVKKPDIQKAELTTEAKQKQEVIDNAHDEAAKVYDRMASYNDKHTNGLTEEENKKVSEGYRSSARKERLKKSFASRFFEGVE